MYLKRSYENQQVMNRDYYKKRLYNYLRLTGSKSVSTLTVYESTLDIILTAFPEPDKADLLQIQNFAITFENDNTQEPGMSESK